LWEVNKKAQYGVNMGPYILCLVTIDEIEKAANIAKALVEKKLAACANIIPQIRSIYAWKGEIYDEKEVLMIIKTRSDLFEMLKNEIRRLHSYEVPEIICITIDNGLQDYLDWIDASTRN
jgi:periplasmic divalent cation tolerance protein